MHQRPLPPRGHHDRKNRNAGLNIMNRPSRTRLPDFPAIRLQRAFTLVELMVAMTIGLLLVSALLAVFMNVSRTNREMAKTNILIENGRFAVQLLQNDLIHAGYWGELDFTGADDIPPAVPALADIEIPNPCLAVAGWTSEHKENLLSIPVQGFADATGLSTCGVTGVLGTSDVLLVRHANTCARGAANCDEGTDTGPHIQVSACREPTNLPPPRPPGIEPDYLIEPIGATPPSPATFWLRGKTCPTFPLAALNAPLRKVVSHIYYLALSGSPQQPTLMRIAMENGAYTAPQPFIEGIEQFRVEYGIDENGKNGLPISATNPGDGSADRFITTEDLVDADAAAPCDTAGSRCFLLANTVAVKVHVLARNLEPTPGHRDNKTYQLGATTIAAANDNFKRHVFSSTVRLVNPSGRRETP
jgi:type IV pilus assembly protein PilW